MLITLTQNPDGVVLGCMAVPSGSRQARDTQRHMVAILRGHRFRTTGKITSKEQDELLCAAAEYVIKNGQRVIVSRAQTPASYNSISRDQTVSLWGLGKVAKR